MAVLCSLETCQYFSYCGCGNPRKKENGGRFILPTFRPGKICIWGEAKFDAADFIRYQIAIAKSKQVRAIPCGPACSYWIYLYYRSEDDFEAVCECPSREGMGLPVGQMCRVAVPINKEIV